jgi:hypothetical protein
MIETAHMKCGKCGKKEKIPKEEYLKNPIRKCKCEHIMTITTITKRKSFFENSTAKGLNK